MPDSLPPLPEPSPGGIAQCLRMLAEEAASLKLERTVLALIETMEICEVEASAAAPRNAVLRDGAPSDGGSSSGKPVEAAVH